MLQLHQFASVNGRNISPFCYKVELYCQLAGIAYQAVPDMPQKAPLGKLPFIIDQGKTIADSGAIIEYLKATYGDPLDSTLTEQQRSLGHLLRRTCEESLYFVLVYSRWLDDDAWPMLKSMVFPKLPPIIRHIVPYMVRRHIRKTLWSQGYGRHSKADIYALGAADLAAIATYLAQTPFAVSDAPTSFDAMLYAFIDNIVTSYLDSPLKTSVMQHPSLMKYHAKMQQLLAAKPEQH